MWRCGDGRAGKAGNDQKSYSNLTVGIVAAVI